MALYTLDTLYTETPPQGLTLCTLTLPPPYLHFSLLPYAASLYVSALICNIA
jgi:hypothetical protein